MLAGAYRQGVETYTVQIAIQAPCLPFFGHAANLITTGSAGRAA
jgi:hypothetical protein